MSTFSNSSATEVAAGPRANGTAVEHAGLEDRYSETAQAFYCWQSMDGTQGASVHESYGTLPLQLCIVAQTVERETMKSLVNQDQNDEPSTKMNRESLQCHHLQRGRLWSQSTRGSVWSSSQSLESEIGRCHIAFWESSGQAMFYLHTAKMNISIQTAFHNVATQF